MKYKEYTHHGVISIGKIKEDTGADKVLVPLYQRKVVKGYYLVAIRQVGGLDIQPAWRWLRHFNNKYMAIYPKYLINLKNAKTTEYSIDPFKNSETWVESSAQQNKQGKPFQDNTFILIFKDE